MGRELWPDWEELAGDAPSGDDAGRPPSNGDGEAGQGVPLEEWARLLGSGRRRTTLAAVEGETGSLPLRDLAEVVARRETEEDVADWETVRRVAISLHHVHLPVLADAGVVDYDAGRNLVEAR